MNKFKKAYTVMPEPTKAALFFTLCNFLQRGISLVTSPIFTRILTTEQYGVFTIFNSWYNVISVFATFNLSYGVFITGLTKFEDDRNRFSSSMLGLSTVITGVCLSVYLVSTDFWNKLFGLNTLLVLAMFFELLFAPAFAFWSNIQRNEYKYKALVLVTIIMSLANPLLGILTVVSTDYKAEARILSMVLVQACIGLVFYVLLFKRGKQFYSKKYWKYALAFNIPLIPHYLSMTLLQQTDRIMINNFFGTSEAAIYGVAYTVATMMKLVTTAINNSFTPYTYQSLKTHKYHGIRSTANLLLLLVGAGCIFAMAFGPEIIMILAPREYHDAIWIIPPVAVSVYFMFLYPLFGNIEFYYEKTKFTMLASCCGTGLNIILNYIFIRKYGYFAAGYTTLVCYILFALAHYIAFSTIIKEKGIVEKIYDIRFMVMYSLCLIALMLVVLFTYKLIIIRYGIIFIILLLMLLNRKRIIIELGKLKK